MEKVLQKSLLLFQFLMVQLKVAPVLMSVHVISMFQFLMVQLKEAKTLYPYRLVPFVSIPNGSIKRPFRE